MSDLAELLDLVNGQDIVIGTIVHRDAFALNDTKLGYVRAVNALLINDQNQVWVPRRKTTKEFMPGALDFSVSEHVPAGESYDQAIVRGFLEELRLTVQLSELRSLGVLPPREHLPYFSGLYVYHSSTTPDFSHDEYETGDWYDASEIIGMLQNGTAAKPALLPSLLALGYKA